MKTSSHSSNQPRTEARKSKLRELTPVQVESLTRWLMEENVIYAEARNRLQKRFSVSLSIHSIYDFFHKYCARPATPKPDVLFDITIQPSTPVRLIAKRKNGEIELIFKSPADGKLPMGEPIGKTPTSE
jgi:hypothetical protein